MNNIRCVIFDFDGTIADSLDLMLKCFNECSSKYRYKPIADVHAQEIRQLTLKQLFARQGVRFWQIPRLTTTIRRMLQSSIIEIQPFSEMRQVIADIKRSGIQIGLLSSNAEENVRSFLDEHDFPVFDFVEAGSSLFGKAKHLKRICRTYGLDPQTVAYVGDEIRDIEAAKSVGMHMLAVSWGFSAKEALSGADAICLEPGDILNAIPAPHSDSVRSF